MRCPLLVFAAVDLAAGSGGIAELSRQVFKVLLAMHHERRISLRVCVLEGSGPAVGDPLFTDAACQCVRWYAGTRRRFSLALIAARADLFLLDHVGLARSLAILPRALARRYLVLVHGVEIWNSGRRDYHDAARRAVALIANSAYTARKIRQECPGLPDIRVCWPGLDAPASGGNSKPQPDGIGPHAALIVGRLSAAQRHKGHDHLLEAMPRVLESVQDAQLVVTGTGDDLVRLQQKARRLGVSEQVLFTGWVDEDTLSSLYSRCAIFVMPSVGDGFGLVFLEAMMRGKPCLGQRDAAAAEIFEGGKCGTLVDREDRDQLAATITGLLTDPRRRQELGHAAYRRYRDHFTGAHFAGRLRFALTDYLETPSN